MSRAVSERAVVAIVTAVQFVNILDFLIVMPLGPDFALALGIPLPQLGYIGGSYAAAAALVGLAGMFFLDRFDRRQATLVCMLGLSTATALTALAGDLAQLIAARLVAGAFGGPAMALCLSIVADVVPPQRRGWAMAWVMSSFTVASVLGVPVGLELSRLWGWQAPFLVVAAQGFAIAVAVYLALPPLRGHLVAGAGRPRVRLRQLVQPVELGGFAMTFAVMISGFLLFPHVATYWQGNLGYPRARLGLLYLVGGAASFVLMRVAGRFTDRLGSTTVGTAAMTVVFATVLFTFVVPLYAVPPLLLFVFLMMSNSSRFVAYNALISRVPRPAERAGFMSLNSTVQHGAAALGAMVSARLLSETPAGALVGVPAVGALSLAFTTALPALMWLVERGVRRREAGGGQPAPEPPATPDAPPAPAAAPAGPGEA